MFIEQEKISKKFFLILRVFPTTILRNMIHLESSPAPLKEIFPVLFVVSYKPRLN
jgi:hypothetical protein